MRTETTKDLAARLRGLGGPMSAAEVGVLRDMQGFIEFAIRNGLSFNTVIGNLHGVTSTIVRYNYDLDATQGWTPKIAGYEKINEDDVGQPTEQVEPS